MSAASRLPVTRRLFLGTACSGLALLGSMADRSTRAGAGAHTDNETPQEEADRGERIRRVMQRYGAEFGR